MYSHPLRTIILVTVLGVIGCSPALEKIKPFKLEPVNFKSLPGWADDNHSDALDVFRGSCQKFLAGNIGSPSNRLGLKLGSWHSVCLSLPAGDVNDDQAQVYFEKWFQPYLVFGPDGS